MKHPCVELYFDIELSKASIRVWLKTDNKIQDGNISKKFYEIANEIREGIIRVQQCPELCPTVSDYVSLLEKQEQVSAFQVTDRADYRNLGVVVYREWP